MENNNGARSFHESVVEPKPFSYSTIDPLFFSKVTMVNEVAYCVKIVLEVFLSVSLVNLINPNTDHLQWPNGHDARTYCLRILHTIYAYIIYRRGMALHLSVSYLLFSFCLCVRESMCVDWRGGSLIGMWWRSSSCSFTDRRVQFQFVRYFVRASGLAPIPEQLSFRRNAQQSM